jgi:signal recognition particle subunit SRP54
MEVSELNKLLKMHRQMADAMKKMGKMGKTGLLRQMGGMLGLKGGMPSEAEIAKAREQLAASGGLPKGLPGLGGGGLQLPPGLSGFGKKK